MFVSCSSASLVWWDAHPFKIPTIALPPGFEKVLPPDVIQKLRAIHESTSMTPEQQHEKIDEIMSSLPPEIHDKLPTPPFFAKLPPATQAQLKALHRDRTLTWKQRHEKIRAVIDALPPNLRPPPPPGPPPPPPGFGRREFGKILISDDNTPKKNNWSGRWRRCVVI
ncbi:unnamed protein product [Nippostrongylus brasiliensis]|uniref:Uncharacterized protein n=1 Tax=Nippostrongylus brasiliensis TaxID=27835 RepID=A0A0N4YLR8_NIPBR|nr:unnamed protein product [Nippostrongylus brasiliensis]